MAAFVHPDWDIFIMRLSAFLLVAASSAAFAQGQPSAQTQGSGPILTLEEAVQLSIRNNPTHLQSLSSRSRQGSSLRSAYGALLPTVSSSFSTSFREGGQEIVGGQQFGSSNDILSSSYSIGINAFYNGQRLMQPRVERANLNAADADVTSSAAATRAQVVTQYLNVLQAQARAALQDTLLANSNAQLELNKAREQVGATTSLEVRRSEVQVGTARVNVLRERNNAEIEMLRLFQFMGIDRMEGVRLTTTFPVSEPTLQLNELMDMARRANPVLNAARARESAANVGVTAARSQYLPSLSFQTGFQGNSLQQTNIEPSIASARLQTDNARRSCLSSDSLRVGAGLAPRGGCDQIVFTDADAAAMRTANEQFPFNFQKSPFGYGVSLSLPIFNGFQREQAIQSASASRNEARYRVRAQELQLNTDVTSAYRNLLTQYQTVQLQEQNRSFAQQALELAQERYRVGASTFLDVSQARTDFETAGQSLINAIYDFHKFYAALEQAVGRPLR
jgi:outer membrane protein